MFFCSPCPGLEQDRQPYCHSDRSSRQARLNDPWHWSGTKVFRCCAFQPNTILVDLFSDQKLRDGGGGYQDWRTVVISYHFMYACTHACYWLKCWFPVYDIPCLWYCNRVLLKNRSWQLWLVGFPTTCSWRATQLLRSQSVASAILTELKPHEAKLRKVRKELQNAFEAAKATNMLGESWHHVLYRSIWSLYDEDIN